MTVYALFGNSANIIAMVSFIDKMKLHCLILGLVFLNHVLTIHLRSIDNDTTMQIPIKRNAVEKSKGGLKSCKRKCFDEYDFCKRASASLNGSLECMKTKLKCMKKCADLKFSKFFKKLK